MASRLQARSTLSACARRQLDFRRRPLIPLGQTDGQRVLAALERAVDGAAAHALATPLDEVGTCAFRADLAGMRHETQYTRLFRS
jgi:urease accessory protein